MKVYLAKCQFCGKEWLAHIEIDGQWIVFNPWCPNGCDFKFSTYRDKPDN